MDEISREEEDRIRDKDKTNKKRIRAIGDVLRSRFGHKWHDMQVHFRNKDFIKEQKPCIDALLDNGLLKEGYVSENKYMYVSHVEKKYSEYPALITYFKEKMKEWYKVDV